MEQKRDLNLLVISQYFWPENFRVNDIVSYYKDRNVNIEILTGVPNYPIGKVFKEYKNNKKKFDTYKGFKIHRVPMIARGKGSNTLLVFNYLSFLLSSILFGFFFFRKKKI